MEGLRSLQVGTNYPVGSRGNRGVTQSGETPAPWRSPWNSTIPVQCCTQPIRSCHALVFRNEDGTKAEGPLDRNLMGHKNCFCGGSLTSRFRPFISGRHPK